MSTAAFIAAILALGGAVGAVTLRNLIHCALCLVLTFFSVAALYLLLGAEFLAFAQVMVYVGAIAMLIVFATLLTRSAGTPQEALAFRPWLAGVGIAGVVTGAIIACVLASRALPTGTPEVATVTVRRLGEELMTRYVVPLEIIGLLLTAAMIGAVVLAMRETGRGGETGREGGEQAGSLDHMVQAEGGGGQAGSLHHKAQVEGGEGETR